MRQMDLPGELLLADGTRVSTLPELIIKLDDADYIEEILLQALLNKDLEKWLKRLGKSVLADKIEATRIVFEYSEALIKQEKIFLKDEVYHPLPDLYLWDADLYYTLCLRVYWFEDEMGKVVLGKKPGVGESWSDGAPDGTITDVRPFCEGVAAVRVITGFDDKREFIQKWGYTSYQGQYILEPLWASYEQIHKTELLKMVLLGGS